MSATLASTKHFRLAQTLRREVKRLRPGEPLPTSRELQARFGASQATVDRALLRLRQEGLVHRPAGEKRLVISEVCDPATRRVALIRPDWPSAVIEESLGAVALAGKQRDWAFEIVCYRSHKGLDLERAIGENDAAVFMAAAEEVPEHLSASLRHPRKPVILVQDHFEGLGLPTVVSDDRRVAEMSVEYLGSLGHRRILLVLPCQRTSTMQEAVAGWRTGMQRLVQTNVEELLLDTAVPPFQQSLRWSYEFCKHWMESGGVPFTAVFGATAESVLSMWRVLRESGLRVPQDVSLVGSAGIIEWGPYLNPPLTSCEYDMSEYGRAVVELLEQRFAEPLSPPRVVRLQPNLVVRESAAAPGRGWRGGSMARIPRGRDNRKI